MEINTNWRKEFFRVLKVLQDNGVDITSIPIAGTKNGERYKITLKDIRQEKVDIETVIKENELDRDYPIGNYLNRVRLMYNGTKGVLPEDERKTVEDLGIVKRIPENRKKTLFKGRKVSEFHVDIIRKNLAKILTGELNTVQILLLINEKARELNETEIRDGGTIKRIVKMILKDKPEDLKTYEKNLRKNSGKGRVYESQKAEFRDKIINVYLPKLIAGEITLTELETKLGTSHHTVDNIIKQYYLDKKDNKGFEEYEESKRYNRGTSPLKRSNAKKMREEVEKYDVVSVAEFSILSEKEQDEQIIMKIRQGKLKEERSGEKFISAVHTETTTVAAIQRVKNYFRSKNNYEDGIENFTEQDIRYIIFRYPTIINRDTQTLDEKLDVLISYEDISESTAYGMIKTFPAIMGYDAERTRKQLDLLHKEHLIDCAINNPTRLMNSPGLLYALIQFAKERYKTEDLSEISRSNIFMHNNSIKRMYGTSYDELKKRFPYSEEEQEEIYSIDGQDIGKGSVDVGVAEADEAYDVISKAINKSKGEK